MANDPSSPRPPLSGGAILLRLAAIGALLAALAGAFLYAGGWLTPGKLGPHRFLALLEKAGIHAGYRRNHAKGLCVAGYFESNGQGARLSKASVFQAGRVPVVGRFSIGGGDPRGADGPQAVRGLGLQFHPADGQEWRTAMIHFPVFPVRTPEEFYGLLVATAPDPATGKPDGAKVKAFLGSHPGVARALGVIQTTPPPPFADAAYHGLNAFYFTNTSGATVPVRWTLVPENPAAAAAAAEAGEPDKNILFDQLLGRLENGPLRWRLVLTVGRPGDPTDDASTAWPDDREQVDAGTVVIERAVGDKESRAQDLNFDPLVLPPGIAPSADPLLSARSAVYSRSFTRRAGEKLAPGSSETFQPRP
ncbi:MAG: catalase family peroxidase [Verrucomicrobium sp.]|nr:catalase family peroxidase [Verrucomicrobium sp.]